MLALEAKHESMDIIRKRLAENLRAAECNQQAKCTTSLSIGMVHYNPEKPCPIEELLHRADMLMYQEKKFIQGK